MTEYMSFDDEGRCTEVRCKGCPTVIAAQAFPKGNVRPTQSYAEVAIEMVESNGLLSKHITGMCVDCAKMMHAESIPSVTELALLYATDVEQWRCNAVRGKMDPTEITMCVARQEARRPVRLLED